MILLPWVDYYLEVLIKVASFRANKSIHGENEAREILGKEPFPLPGDDEKLTKKSSGRNKPRR